MPDRFEEIHCVLRELYEKDPDIEACMVVRKGFEGVIMFPDDFAKKVTCVWEPLRETIDALLELIEDNATYGIDKNYLEILDYGIVFCILGMTDTSLVTFISKKEGCETIKMAAEKLPLIAETRATIEEIADI